MLIYQQLPLSQTNFRNLSMPSNKNKVLPNINIQKQKKVMDSVSFTRYILEPLKNKTMVNLGKLVSQVDRQKFFITLGQESQCLKILNINNLKLYMRKKFSIQNSEEENYLYQWKVLSKNCLMFEQIIQSQKVGGQLILITKYQKCQSLDEFQQFYVNIPQICLKYLINEIIIFYKIFHQYFKRGYGRVDLKQILLTPSHQVLFCFNTKNAYNDNKIIDDSFYLGLVVLKLIFGDLIENLIDGLDQQNKNFFSKNKLNSIQLNYIFNL